ncbi:MAG TPA: energy transducer TonB [Candidatus Krumholzibacteria bacterium]|nr:energy transducer TonB [Candidatus Krumholzibacteria bacterium]HPD70468.1 energy transducer TonB [Candidatus Krumholzibacteria bacterium]HRY39832.1 energy transducer TonB [Candidatus Krumholzibacteria bacterium]
MSATVFTIAREMDAIGSRTRRSQGISLALHGALFLWLILHRQLAPVPEQLVEVTWLDPEPVAVEPASPASPPVLPEVRVDEPAPMIAAAPNLREARFPRPTETADLAPRPQDIQVTRDAVRSQLDRFRASRETAVALAAAADPSSRLAAAAAPPATGLPGGTTPAELARNAAPVSAAPLTRSGTPARQPALAVAAPTSSAFTRVLPETPTSSTAERVLGSARLSGEVADRPVIRHEMPGYPDWATRQAVEADVTLGFVVLADGSVKSGVQVSRTAGFLDFDDASVAALLRWRFAPLPAGNTAEQRGSITFHFRIRDQR